MEKINTPEENIFDMIKRLDLGEKSILEVVTEIDKLRHDKVSLLADVRRLVEAGKIRIDKWHNDTCSKVLIGGNESYMCDCGHEELKQAVAAVERHLEGK